MNYNYISVEGNIGVGKSTLAQNLAAQLGFSLFKEEFDENPILPLFYQNKAKFAFALEFSFLIDRFRQINRLSDQIKSSQVISDYAIEKCLHFAKLNLKVEEFKQYKDYFDRLFPLLPQPDLFIFLHAEPKDLLENIKKRNRPYEQEITEDYLKIINEAYQNYAYQKRNASVLLFKLKKLNEETYRMVLIETLAFLKTPSNKAHLEITI